MVKVKVKVAPYRVNVVEVRVEGLGKVGEPGRLLDQLFFLQQNPDLRGPKLCGL